MSDKPIREWTIKWSGYDLTGEGTNFELILQASGYNLERNEKVKVVEAAPVLARIKELKEKLDSDNKHNTAEISRLREKNILLEAENDRFKAQLEKCKEQRDFWGSKCSGEYRYHAKQIDSLNAEIEAIE